MNNEKRRLILNELSVSEPFTYDRLMNLSNTSSVDKTIIECFANCYYDTISYYFRNLTSREYREVIIYLSGKNKNFKESTIFNLSLLFTYLDEDDFTKLIIEFKKTFVNNLFNDNNYFYFLNKLSDNNVKKFLVSLNKNELNTVLSNKGYSDNLLKKIGSKECYDLFIRTDLSILKKAKNIFNYLDSSELFLLYKYRECYGFNIKDCLLFDKKFRVDYFNKLNIDDISRLYDLCMFDLDNCIFTDDDIKNIILNKFINEKGVLPLNISANSFYGYLSDFVCGNGELCVKFLDSLDKSSLNNFILYHVSNRSSLAASFFDLEVNKPYLFRKYTLSIDPYDLFYIIGSLSINKSVKIDALENFFYIKILKKVFYDKNYSQDVIDYLPNLCIISLIDRYQSTLYLDVFKNNSDFAMKIPFENADLVGSLDSESIFKLFSTSVMIGSNFVDIPSYIIKYRLEYFFNDKNYDKTISKFNTEQLVKILYLCYQFDEIKLLCNIFYDERLHDNIINSLSEDEILNLLLFNSNNKTISNLQYNVLQSVINRSDLQNEHLINFINNYKDKNKYLHDIMNSNISAYSKYLSLQKTSDQEVNTMVIKEYTDVLNSKKFNNPRVRYFKSKINKK